jgi:hypothetical protein
VPAGQAQGDRTAQAPHSQVDPGAQAAPRAAEGLIPSPFLGNNILDSVGAKDGRC